MIWESTSSPPLHLNNSLKPISSPFHQENYRLLRSKRNPTLLEGILTGILRELLSLSKIKVNVALAGLSQQLEVWRLSKLKYGKLQSFSEQMLVDCSDSYGNNACNGGLADNAYRFVIDNGIVRENDYPYVAVKQNSCRTGRGPFKISALVDLQTCQDLYN